MAVHQLQHLALGDRVGGVREHPHHAHAVHAQHHLEGARIEEVADQHRSGVAELGVGRVAAAPQFRAIHHVVVQQRGGVDEFDHRGEFQVPFPARAPRVAAGPGRQQHQRRAQALAAPADDVLGNTRHQGHVRRKARADHRVDAPHVGFDRRQQGEQLHRGRKLAQRALTGGHEIPYNSKSLHPISRTSRDKDQPCMQ
jgi:hypothetical protein